MEAIMDGMQSQAQRLLGSNYQKILPLLPLITLAFGGAGFGGYISSFLHERISNVWRRIRALFVVSILIRGEDRNYTRVEEFLTHLVKQTAELEQKRFWIIRWFNKLWNGIHSSYKAKTHIPRNQDWRERRADDRIPKIDFEASDVGRYNVEYEGATITVYAARKERESALWGHPEPIRSIELAAHPWNLSLLKKLINDAMRFSVEQDRSMLKIYQMSDSWWRPWDKAATKEPRAFDTVILDQEIANEILRDAQKFVSVEEREYYMQRGIPYHRGYLFYGPPGTGKTSFAQALAGSIKTSPMDICLLNLASQKLDDARLNTSLRYAPKNAIILLEDVDAVFVQRSAASMMNEDSSRPGNKQSGVSFSGLLNAIDGVASQEGRIFIMTTNHPEKLDPALVRDGRCDRKWEFGNCSSVQLKRMFKISYRGMETTPSIDELAALFAKQIAANSMAPAAIQGYLLPNRDPKVAANPKNVQAWLLKTDKNKAVKHVSLEDHLRTVGLEFLLPALNYYGYLEVSDLRNLNAPDIKRWSPLLKYQPGAVERLGQLIRAESSWVKENCLPVTPAFVQDVFLAKYVGRAAEVDELLSFEKKSETLENKVSRESTDISIPLPPQRSRLRRQSSFDLQVEQDKQARKKVRTVLTGNDGQSGLRARIFRKGQGLISRWQLRHLVSLYSTAEAALDKACFFVRTLDRQKLLRDLEEDDSPVAYALRAAEAEDVSPIYKRYINLSAGQWLRLAGLEQYTSAFNKAGLTNSADFSSVDEKTLKADIGMRNKSHRLRFTAIVRSDSTQPKILADFALVTCKTARQIFRKAFPGEIPGCEEEVEIMEACVDPRGHGKVSKFQLKAFLRRHRGDLSGAMESLVDELGTDPRPQPGAIERSDEDYFYDFLRRAGLEPLFLVLRDHGVVGPNDLSESSGITTDMVKQWCPALGWDLEASKRLKKLLARNDSFMDDEHAPATADMIQCICRDIIGSEESGVCEALVEILAKDPMVGTASQWQVRQLLKLHGNQLGQVGVVAKDPLFAGVNRPSDEVLESKYGYYGTRTAHDWYKQWLLRSGIGFEQYYKAAEGRATDEKSMKKFIKQKIASCDDEHSEQASSTLELDRSTPSGEKIFLRFILLSRTAVATTLQRLFGKQLDAEKLDANKIALDYVDPHTGRGTVTVYQLEELKERVKDQPDWDLSTILKGVYDLSDKKIEKEKQEKKKPEGPVIDFLTQLKFPNYGKAFHDNGVDVIEDLTTITDEELKSIGVEKVGHRKKILRAIKAMEES